MKNIFFFLIFFVLIGCSSTDPIIDKISCPNILFSEEHDIFVLAKEGQIENEISYTARINNFVFTSDCFVLDNAANFDLELLFIVDPASANKPNILLPFYIATVDQFNKLIDMQYYNISGDLKISDDGDYFIQTELRTKIKHKLSYQNITQDSNYILIIGFMLSRNQLEILN